MRRLFVTSTRAPRFEADGVEVIHTPLLKTVCLEAETPRGLRTAVFFSRNAVECASNLELDWATLEVWAVGERTAETVAESLGVDARIPESHDFAGIVTAFEHTAPPAPIGAFELADGPRSLAASLPTLDILTIAIYETRIAPDPRLTGLRRGDALLIASPRALEGIERSLDSRSLEDLASSGVRIGVIGPTTRDAAAKLGIAEPVMVTPPNLEALCGALMDHD